MLKIISYLEYTKRIKYPYSLPEVCAALTGKLHFYESPADSIIIVVKSKGILTEFITFAGLQIEQNISYTLDGVFKDYSDGEYLFDTKKSIVVDKLDNPEIPTSFHQMPPREKDVGFKVLVKSIEGEIPSFYTYRTETGFSSVYAFLYVSEYSFLPREGKAINHDVIKIMIKLLASRLGFSDPNIHAFSSCLESIISNFHPNGKNPQVNNDMFLEYTNNFLMKLYEIDMKETVQLPPKGSFYYLDEIVEMVRENKKLPDGVVICPFNLNEIKDIKLVDGILIFNTTLDQDSISELFGIPFENFECIEEK